MSGGRPGTMMQSRWLRLLVALLTALGANGWTGTTEAGGRVLYERDFTRDTALAASVDDVVLLELERGAPRRWEENRWRHRLDAGIYSFCLEPDDPLLAQVVLEDSFGRALLRLGRGRPPRAGHPECATLSLPSGLYHLRALHDSSGISGPSRLGFVRVVAKSPPLVKNGTPVGGLWALQPDTGQGRIALPSSWSRTGDLLDALAEHTATLLPDGRVLVAGGLDGSNEAAEFTGLYDPATAQFTFTGTMTTGRLLHTATLLASGMVLVAGGWGGDTLASSELYDPGSGQWTASGSMKTARIQFTATLLPSGRVLVAGGSTTLNGSTPVASVELYDPATGLWAPTGAMTVTRSNHTATLLSSGQVLVVGGDATGTSAELYDPGTGTWTPTGSLQTGRSFHAAALLPSGKVLVTGGLTRPSNTPLRSAELYEPTTRQWSLTGAMSEARALHTATRLASGQVLVAGGSITRDGRTPLASTEQYDPSSQTWAPTEALGTPRAQHTATLLTSSDVLVAGGFDGQLPTETTELFPATRPLIADSASTSIDAGALFSFVDPTRPLAFLDGGRPLDLHKLDPNGFWTLFAHVNDTPPVQTFFQDTSPLFLTDLGYYRAELGVRRADGSAAKVFVDRSSVPAGALELNYDFIRNDPASPLFAQVLFRFFPDGTQVGELSEGEVAIFQQCNYQGKAAVFAVDTPSLAALTSALVTLDKTAASIRLGNNTGVVLYTEAGYSGTSQTVEVDTPCLEGTPIGIGTTSLQVRPLAPTLLVSSRSCENCQLVGVDLSGLDLSGVDLWKANLDGAVGSSTTVLSGATLTRASLRQADLGQAKLYGAQLNQADLEGANLGGAFLTNNRPPGIAVAASLVGAHLKNVNLSGAQLSGADFTNASFYGSNAAGTGSCTIQASGFTLACATAAGATMNNTQFGNAYLYGADFTNTTVQGVQFGGAVLIGANFTGAKVFVDPTVGTNVGFTEAFLQGTNLAGADLNGTSLFGALVDFRAGGNTMVLLLNEKFAGFPNWHAPNQAICIVLAYGSGTSVPAGNTTLTCPDGTAAGAGGCGATNAENTRWASSLDIATDDPAGSYFLDATYTPAGLPVCPAPDTAW